MRLLGWNWKLTCLSLGVLALCACAEAGRLLNDSLVTRPFRHHVWQEVLNQSVNSQAEVDFGKVRAHPKRLNDYLGQLAACSPENDPTAFPKADDKTAYWINAHNALAMRMIVDHYPVASLNKIPNLETNAHYQLGGKPYSLKKIRQKLGLQAKQDPRLLFTLTDYTFSSPHIQQEAYESGNLKRLEKQAVQEGLANRQMVQMDSGAACVGLKLSSFFKGYERGLFSRTVASVEDHDDITEEGFVPVSFTSWTDHLRPLMPPSVYSRLGKDCGKTVTFLPGDKTLRQVRF